MKTHLLVCKASARGAKRIRNRNFPERTISHQIFACFEPSVTIFIIVFMVEAMDNILKVEIPIITF